MTLLSSHSELATRVTPPPCDVCGQTRALLQWSLQFDGYAGTFDLWRCRSCGHLWNWPQLPPQAIKGQYNGAYYVFTSPPARRWSRAAQLYLNHLYPLERTPGTGRLLEVGCARGELLALAQARGWDVQGIEISGEAAAATRADYRLPVHTGTLEEYINGSCDFDVLIATDVIEHVTSPRRFALAVRRALRPEGVAIIETPNSDSLWRRFGGRAWLGFNRFHLHLFNSRSLTRLMRNCGFTRCRAGTTTNFAYSRWGHRPELMRWGNHLPPALRWRFIKWLNGLTPRSPATELEDDPVTSLDEAVRRVEQVGPNIRRWQPSSRLTGDNLVVCAQANAQPANQREAGPNDWKGSESF